MIHMKCEALFAWGKKNNKKTFKMLSAAFVTSAFWVKLKAKNSIARYHENKLNHKIFMHQSLNAAN